MKYNIIFFEGLILKISFPQNFKHNLMLKEKKGFNINFLNKTQLKKIEIESIEFNSLFNIYTNDKFKTFTFLKPKIINDIEDFSKYNNSFFFYEKNIYITFRKKTSFLKPSIFTKLTKKKIQNYINYLEQIEKLLENIIIKNSYF